MHLKYSFTENRCIVQYKIKNSDIFLSENKILKLFNSEQHMKNYFIIKEAVEIDDLSLNVLYAVSKIEAFFDNGQYIGLLKELKINNFYSIMMLLTKTFDKIDNFKYHNIRSDNICDIQYAAFDSKIKLLLSLLKEYEKEINADNIEDVVFSLLEFYKLKNDFVMKNGNCYINNYIKEYQKNLNIFKIFLKAIGNKFILSSEDIDEISKIIIKELKK